MTHALVLRGGTVHDGTGAPGRLADVAVVDGQIVEVRERISIAGAQTVDCRGRYVLPGMIDTHSHADNLVFTDEVQKALLRQGVTTIVVGQDGVSQAPGDGVYANNYFAALAGRHPHYRGGGMSELLRSYRALALNVACLVGHNTVRHEIMGFADRPATPSELDQMRTLVRQAIREGAAGLSSGLDYIPGCHGNTAELIALAGEAAALDSPYVTHMRGGYEETSGIGINEVAEIARASGVDVHISHLHARPELIAELIAGLRSEGIEATYDAYPYTRGNTLLSMIALPPEFAELDASEFRELAGDARARAMLASGIREFLNARPNMVGHDWDRRITVSHVEAERHADICGLTLAEIAVRRAVDPVEFIIDALADSAFVVSVIVEVPYSRTDENLGQIFSSPHHMGGSDGIFLGRHPHPRAYGSFARYLSVFVHERGDLDWATAAQHFAGNPARLFRFRDHGIAAPGFAADLIVVDPDAVTATASYETPRSYAIGVDDVVVAGQLVLRDGELTGRRPGRGVSPIPRFKERQNAELS